MLPTMKNRWADPFLSAALHQADSNWAVSEDDQSIHLDLDLPGFKKDEVKLSVDGVLLHVEAKTEIEEGSSRRDRAFNRKFRLAEAYRGAEVEARLEDGVLALVIHKPEASKVRHIEVG